VAGAGPPDSQNRFICSCKLTRHGKSPPYSWPDADAVYANGLWLCPNGDGSQMLWLRDSENRPSLFLDSITEVYEFLYKQNPQLTESKWFIYGHRHAIVHATPEAGRNKEIAK
jgi:hypothetical protein